MYLSSHPLSFFIVESTMSSCSLEGYISPLQQSSYLAFCMRLILTYLLILTLVALRVEVLLLKLHYTKLKLVCVHSKVHLAHAVKSSCQWSKFPTPSWFF